MAKKKDSKPGKQDPVEEPVEALEDFEARRDKEKAEAKSK